MWILLTRWCKKEKCGLNITAFVVVHFYILMGLLYIWLELEN